MRKLIDVITFTYLASRFKVQGSFEFSPADHLGDDPWLSWFLDYLILDGVEPGPRVLHLEAPHAAGKGLLVKGHRPPAPPPIQSDK